MSPDRPTPTRTRRPYIADKAYIVPHRRLPPYRIDMDNLTVYSLRIGGSTAYHSVQSGGQIVANSGGGWSSAKELHRYAHATDDQVDKACIEMGRTTDGLRIQLGATATSVKIVVEEASSVRTRRIGGIKALSVSLITVSIPSPITERDSGNRECRD